MKIGIFTKSQIKNEQLHLVNDILKFLVENKINTLLHSHVYNLLAENTFINKNDFTSFDKLVKNRNEIDYLICIGGDGTILDAVEVVSNTGVPIIGINSGRLGFLASVSNTGFINAFNELKRGSFQLDKRALLHLESNLPLFDFNYALNDLVLHKKETSSMITIHAFLNGEPLNSYWADGLIISTPTGSTGYSLSCGGPILMPHSSNIVITPIAPHNLNVRPVIIPDNQVLSFELEGRGKRYLASLDSRSITIDSKVQMAIRKANFEINLVKFSGDTFLNNLRMKMMWGIDTRN